MKTSFYFRLLLGSWVTQVDLLKVSLLDTALCSSKKNIRNENFDLISSSNMLRY